MQASARTSDDRILIVDDDEVIAVTLFQHLVRRGLPADLALDLHTAEQMLQSVRYSLVLIDPYLTGQSREGALDLTARIRAMAPNAQILLVTAYASVPLSEELRKLGKVTLVSKPVPLMHLTEIVEATINAQQRENERKFS